MMNSVHLENVEFVQPCPAHYRCRRCSSLDSALSRALCGHGFCGRCVGLVRAPRFQCPVDSRSVEKKELVPDKEITDKIMDLAVYCLQKKRGCKRTMILKELEAHLETCGHVPVSCPCGCSQQVAKRELAQHLTTTCDRRLVACSFCHEEVVYRNMEDHNEVCGERPVICLHCKAEVKRDQLASHEVSCPMKPRNCELSVAGCPFKGTAEELEEHADDVKEHVSVIAKTINQYKLSIQDLEQKLLHSDLENEKLKEQMQDIYPILATIKNLEKSISTLQEKVKKLEIAELTVDEMNNTITRLKDYMQRAQPAVVQDHKAKSPVGAKSPGSKSPPRGLFSHNSSFEDNKIVRHAAPPTDL